MLSSTETIRIKKIARHAISSNQTLSKASFCSMKSAGGEGQNKLTFDFQRRVINIQQSNPQKDYISNFSAMRKLMIAFFVPGDKDRHSNGGGLWSGDGENASWIETVSRYRQVHTDNIEESFCLLVMLV